jgi:hypothetical protein
LYLGDTGPKSQLGHQLSWSSSCFPQSCQAEYTFSVRHNHFQVLSNSSIVTSLHHRSWWKIYNGNTFWYKNKRMFILYWNKLRSAESSQRSYMKTNTPIFPSVLYVHSHHVNLATW